MTKNLQQLLDEGVDGRHVLVRSDFNVPLDDDGNITDAGRIDASLPTLKALLDAGAKVIVMAHLGRPKGEVNPKFSLAPVAEALSERLGQFVPLAADVSGEDAHERANGLTEGEILLLENVRFDPRETSKDEAERAAFADELAALAADDGAFVSDGFGVVHRAQASVYDVAKALPAYAGYLVDKEVTTLNSVKNDPAHPYVVVLGGSKVSDKLGVIEALAEKADQIIIGGGMCYTFLAAQGHDVQNSLLQEDMVGTCEELIERFGGKLLLPVDVAAGAEFAKGTEKRIVGVDAIPEGWMGLDIGPETAKRYAEALASSKTVFWNGPMGVFEFPNFADGTKAVAEAMITATKDNGSFTVVGGGASLELIEGKDLPGVSVLN